MTNLYVFIPDDDLANNTGADTLVSWTFTHAFDAWSTCPSSAASSHQRWVARVVSGTGSRRSRVVVICLIRSERRFGFRCHRPQVLPPLWSCSSTSQAHTFSIASAVALTSTTNTSISSCVHLTLVQRLWRWTNVKLTLVDFLLTGSFLTACCWLFYCHLNTRVCGTTLAVQTSEAFVFNWNHRTNRLGIL